jgi:hypothetical protein
MKVIKQNVFRKMDSVSGNDLLMKVAPLTVLHDDANVWKRTNEK